MKTEFVDVNDTRKNVRVEIPSDIVDAEIERHARVYSRKARIPGFRPGKAPATVIKQRFKEQILHDVANDLIPPAVDEALRERGVEAVDTPDIRDVTVEAGQPLTFTASFDTLPPLEPGAMSYMMSKEQYLTDGNHHNWIAHLMFYTPLMDGAVWGADLSNSPVMLNPKFRGAPEPINVFMVPAGWWSDGTADPVRVK